MKKILLALSLFVVLPTLATNAKDKEKEVPEVVVKNANGIYTYEGVVEVENVPKDEMFKRAKQWVLDNLKTEDNNIGINETNFVINNSASILLEPKGAFSWSITHAATNFKLKLEFRDGRYKFVFDNIIVQAVFSPGGILTLPYERLSKTAPAKYLKSQVNEKISALSQSLEQAVKQGNQVSSTSKEDW